jgi:hypothetical protein
MRGLELTGYRAWKEWKRSGRLDYIPGSSSYNRWLPFTDARDFARSLQLKNQREWTAYAKSSARPNDIPAIPAATYPEWKGIYAARDRNGV